MPNDPSITQALTDVGREMDWALDDGAARAINDFARLFLQWNERINLASLGSATELVERHFIDSFAAARLIADGDRIIDVGTGGGLPALPLAVLRPACRLDLFEPIRKKVAFLRTAVRELGLAARVNVHASAVDHAPPPGLAGAFDVAMSRATLAPAHWLPLGRKLVRPDGHVLVFTAGRSGDPLPPADSVLRYGSNRAVHVFREQCAQRSCST